MRVAALVPCLDCRSTIADVVSATRHHVEHVLVIDDGSRDGTGTVAIEAGAEVLRHETNRGKGAALLTGLRRLADEGYTHALSVDGDGQHLASEIPKIVAEATAHPDAIVVGARADRSHAAGINRFGNAVADLAVRIVAGKRLGDTQSGFRIYPVDRTLALGASSLRYDFETEVLIRAARAGIDVRSIPVEVYYPPAAERISHYDRFWDTLRIVWTVLRLWLRVR